MALNARLPEDLEKLLADYCRRHGVTRTQVVKAALSGYLHARRSPRTLNGYQLAQDLIPEEGAPAIQSDNVRTLARAAFRVRPA